MPAEFLSARAYSAGGGANFNETYADAAFLIPAGDDPNVFLYIRYDRGPNNRLNGYGTTSPAAADDVWEYRVIETTSATSVTVGDAATVAAHDSSWSFDDSGVVHEPAQSYEYLGMSAPAAVCALPGTPFFIVFEEWTPTEVTNKLRYRVVERAGSTVTVSAIKTLTATDISVTFYSGQPAQIASGNLFGASASRLVFLATFIAHSQFAGQGRWAFDFDAGPQTLSLANYQNQDTVLYELQETSGYVVTPDSAGNPRLLVVRLSTSTNSGMFLQLLRVNPDGSVTLGPQKGFSSGWRWNGSAFVFDSDSSPIESPTSLFFDSLADPKRVWLKNPNGTDPLLLQSYTWTADTSTGMGGITLTDDVSVTTSENIGSHVYDGWVSEDHSHLMTLGGFGYPTDYGHCAVNMSTGSVVVLGGITRGPPPYIQQPGPHFSYPVHEDCLLEVSSWGDLVIVWTSSGRVAFAQASAVAGRVRLTRTDEVATGAALSTSSIAAAR